MASNELERAGRLDSNRETIELYLVSEPGEVSLTDKQEELLKRWEYADELIRKNECKREVIAQLIMRRFAVGRATAFQDIVNAERVFASSTPLNKKYRIGLRIEYLERKIQEFYDSDDKDKMIMAGMLEARLVKYYDLYPDITPAKSPKTINFIIQGSVMPAPVMTADDALNAAKRVIDITPKKQDDGRE